jgi:predicted GNAT family acetyltransferase
MSWVSDRVQDAYDYLNPEPLHPAADEPRMRGYRMGQTVEPAPDEAAMAQDAREVAARRVRGELAPSAAVERRFGEFAEPSAPTPPPPPSRADAYRMSGLANMDEYREAPKDAYKRSDVEASARDIVPNANMNEFAASPGEVAAIDQQLDAPLTKEAIDTLRWHGLSDAAIGALSGTTAARYIPDKRVRAAAMVAPIMGALMDPAEASWRDAIAKARTKGYRVEQESPGSFFARKGEHDVGGMYLSTTDPPFIVGIKVQPEFRGQGVGRALYETASQDAARKGQTLVPSPVDLSADAKEIWRKHLAQFPRDIAEDVIEQSRELGRTHGYSASHLDDLLKVGIIGGAPIAFAAGARPAEAAQTTFADRWQPMGSVADQENYNY